MFNRRNKLLLSFAALLALAASFTSPSTAQVMPGSGEETCSPCEDVEWSDGSWTHKWEELCCESGSDCRKSPDAQLGGNPGTCSYNHPPCSSE